MVNSSLPPDSPVTFHSSIVGLGHPLLDISAVVEQDLLDKYGLKLDNQILAEEKHAGLFSELAARSDVEFIAGGATQNSIRVAQWMLQIPNATVYMGCVGTDKYAEKMTEVCSGDGVTVKYMQVDSVPTGTCGVCIKDGERSLVANLAAADKFEISHVQKPENWALIEAAKIVYSAGFFMTSSPETMKLVSEYCCKSNKIYCLNLSAPFLMEVPPFKACLMATLPNADFLFGNENEARTFAKTEGWETEDVKEIAEKIAAMPKSNGSRCRTVVFTQGLDPTVVVHNGQTKTYPVIPLPKEALVDTNGAGDAFVGGFLSQLACGKSLDDAVRAGHYAANVIIQQSGCKFPPKPSFNWMG
eukprot:CAMPEP_0117654556 /NCGR_PEP_ID=MMETSP0804-20121206/3807_1 /TAXON_ID=1074897 /ORGANISM="Tetraselmis astigmatica, Strain CCMP880" /LENGTH=357 /DNA_ID=CAMNT_0005460845 /DNA_START=431 /DNA_END=1504 /DNA_ORIENTATION=-